MKLKKLAQYQEIIKEAYEVNNLTCAELSKMYDCSEGTIRRVLLDQGVARRSPGRRKGTRNKVKENIVNGVQ